MSSTKFNMLRKLFSLRNYTKNMQENDQFDIDLYASTYNIKSLEVDGDIVHLVLSQKDGYEPVEIIEEILFDFSKSCGDRLTFCKGIKRR